MKKNIQPKSLDFWIYSMGSLAADAPSIASVGKDIIKSKESLVEYVCDWIDSNLLSMALAVYYAEEESKTDILCICNRSYNNRIIPWIRHYKRDKTTLINGRKVTFSNQSNISVGLMALNRMHIFRGISKLVIIADNLSTQDIEELKRLRPKKIIILNDSEQRKNRYQ